MNGPLIKTLQLTIWTTSSLLISYLLAYTLPRFGFDFTDHGYYLYNAMRATHFDIPPTGYSSFANGILMLMGIKSYFAFELWYKFLLASSIVLFYTSQQKVSSSLFLPLLILLAFTNKITTILSYQNAPEIFILSALGFLFHGINLENGFQKKLIYAISGALMAFSIWSNVSLIPTIATTILLLYPVTKSKKQISIFYITLILCYLFLGYFYIHSTNSLFTESAHKNVTYLEMLLKIPNLIQYILVKQKFYFILVVSALSLKLITIKARHNHIKSLPPLLFILFSISLFIYYYNLFQPAAPIIRIALLMQYFFKLQLISLILFFKNEEKYFQLCAAALIIMTYASLLAITTFSGFLLHLGLFSVAACVITIMLFENELREYSNIPRVAFQIAGLCLLICYVVSAYFFHTSYSYRAFLPSTVKQCDNKNILRGICANSNKIAAFNEITDIYHKNQCAQKFFLAYPTLPLLYYTLERKAPNNQPWISISVSGLNSSDIINLFSHKKHWCILVAPKFNCNPENYTIAVEAYLKRHSKKQITLGQSLMKTNDLNLYPVRSHFYIR